MFIIKKDADEYIIHLKKMINSLNDDRLGHPELNISKRDCIIFIAGYTQSCVQFDIISKCNRDILLTYARGVIDDRTL